MSKTTIRLVAPVALLGIAVVAITFVAWQRSWPEVEAVLAASREPMNRQRLTIEYPLDETLFPPDIAAPTFRWMELNTRSGAYVVAIEFADGQEPMRFLTREPRWTPGHATWEAIKQRSLQKEATITIAGVHRGMSRRILSANQTRIRTSRDEVGAPIFYREVILPFIDAVKDPARIRWRFGSISSGQQPPVVLEKLPVCGNCHSFSADAAVLGMDVDYANDKGSYVVTPVRDEITLAKSEIITWSDYRREDGEPTFGLLSQVSPDGRYVVSTVKDQSVFVPKPGLAFSQLFFPIKGILCVYDRQTGTFQTLPGADDPTLVQSNPSWSPDGRYIVFARTTTYRLKVPGSENKVLLSPEDCSEFLRDGKPFLYDLYRIPFNDGRGGTPEPIRGASGNGMSNFFARYSPDGRWIVFCQAKSYMLLQPDSKLYIIPADGGEPRRLRANTSRMNSWHSWSPNGRWLVFSSKASSVYTQLFLTHIDEQGNSSPAVLLDRFTASDRAANIPEFVNAKPSAIAKIHEQFLDDYSYFRAGVVSLRVDDPDGAEQAYRKSLALNPDNAKARVDLAYVLFSRGEMAEGLIHTNEALKLDPNNVEAMFNLGMAMALQKKPQEAATQFEKVVQLKPDNPDAHFNLAVVLADLGRRDEAVTHYATAAQLNPNDARFPYNLGVIAADQGKLDEAVKHLSKAIQIKPDYTNAYVNLGAMLARQKKYDQAIYYLTKATQVDPSSIPALLNLAGTYDKIGQRDKAASSLERALNLARSTDDAALVQQITTRLSQYK
ncbi:MAG: tetratricopeptide repeat protein [Sedimentisphaerales bacterium]|nr:tetratricopeptide repeat protein [Sedimentisphaerales bacterium]